MWLVQQQVAPAATCTEHAYAETVRVVKGRALVEHQSTVDYLHTCGYAVVRELPPLETMMRRNPGHLIHLGRQGLGPLAGKTAQELDALQQELDTTGRVASLEPEKPAEVVANEPADPGEEVRQEIIRLIEERDHLQERLAALQSDHADLQQLFQDGAAAAADQMAELQARIAELESQAAPPADAVLAKGKGKGK